MHLHNCRRFEKHLRTLLQSLRAHCKAAGGPGSVWKYLKALVRAIRESGRFVYGFRPNIHFANEDRQSWVNAVFGICCTRCMLYSVLTHDDGMVR